MRPGLVVGVNVDPIDVQAGKEQAATLGYGDSMAQMVVEHALLRWQRGEEESGQRLWLSEYPKDLTSWYAILARAKAAAVPKSQPEPPPVTEEMVDAVLFHRWHPVSRLCACNRSFDNERDFIKHALEEARKAEVDGHVA